LTSRGWVDPVPDPLLLRKSGSAGNRTRDLCICSLRYDFSQARDFFFFSRCIKTNSEDSYSENTGCLSLHLYSRLGSGMYFLLCLLRLFGASLFQNQSRSESRWNWRVYKIL